jgi:hypothetical protein
MPSGPYVLLGKRSKCKFLVISWLGLKPSITPCAYPRPSGQWGRGPR